MLIHNVFFWLRKDLGPEQVADFRSGLDSLKKIEHAEAVYIGNPAAVPKRPVLVSDYDFCLSVLLKDVLAQNAYQQDPIHQAFIAEHKEKWEQVKVYDAD